MTRRRGGYVSQCSGSGKGWMSGALLTAVALSVLWPATAQARSAEPLLSISDPAGDALGKGAAHLPTQPAIRSEALDLLSFEVWPRGEFLTFRVKFAALDNPWNAPAGFSAQTLDIFVGTRTGGETRLADLNMGAAGGGWQHHLRVTGFGGQWRAAPQGGSAEEGVAVSASPSAASAAAATSAQANADAAGPALPAPQVLTAEGNTLVIHTQLPRGRYRYWVTSSVYSPFSAGGVLLPGGSGPFTVTYPQSPQSDNTVPVPLDVLAEEDSPQPFNLAALAPVGHLTDLRPWLLWGLGLLALALALVASVGLWRTPRETVLVRQDSD